jgi:hypothetical protein
MINLLAGLNAIALPSLLGVTLLCGGQAARFDCQ